MHARKLEDQEQPQTGELLAIALEGPVHGIRLAVQPDKHKLCEGTGKVVTESTIKEVVYKAGSICLCVRTKIDFEFHGAKYELDYRTPEERQADAIAGAEKDYEQVQLLAREEIDLRRRGARDARNAAANAVAEMEVTTSLLKEAEDQWRRARTELEAAKKTYGDASLKAEQADEMMKRLMTQRNAATDLKTVAERQAGVLDAEADRLERKWEARLKTHSERIARLKGTAQG